MDADRATGKGTAARAGGRSLGRASTRYTRGLAELPIALRYALAPAAAALAAAVQYVLLPQPAIAPFVFFYFTIALASWLGGRGPGLLAAILSAAIANQLFVPPHRGWALSGPALTATVLFIVSASAVALLCASFRKATLDAHGIADVLRAQAEELTRADAERERLVVELQEADRRKTEFLAMLSHELRNPLAPILNSLFVLEHAEPGGDLARRASAVIERQAQHLTRLVDDLLDVTRISRGKIRLHRERVELASLVRRAAEDHRDVFAQRAIALEVQVGDTLLHVNGDPTRLAQVVGNLLQNAAKFTPANGRATIALAAAGGHAEIAVADTGAGIAPEMLPQLFEPFVQADETLDRTGGGLGLGLALVKGLVELHEGSVRAESAGKGEGARFVVRLPLDDRPPARVAPPPPRRAGTARRVLIVEDSADAAASLKEALELNEHVVEVAHSGPEGLEKVRRFRPDVVVCDIGLPSMSGYEVARTIRAEPALSAVSLVALSGYALPDDVERARQAGFDLHLAKPVDVGTLEREMARLRGGA